METDKNNDKKTYEAADKQTYKKYKLGEMEENFAELIWEHVPVRSGELVRLCEDAFAWKRTTTYTMLKRLCERGLFANENGLVVTLMSREEFRGARGEQFLEENFEGSLPLFVASFVRRKKLKDEEVRMLKDLIDSYEEEQS